MYNRGFKYITSKFSVRDENMEINKVGIFISLFIMLIIGIVLLETTSDATYLATEASGYIATNESVVLSNSTTTNLVNNWITSITTVYVPNATATENITITSANYTIANLNDEDPATIILVAGVAGYAFDGNTSYITYVYQDDSYVRDGTSRVFIRLIKIFFGIAILLMALWGMYQMGIGDFLKRK